MKLVEKESSPLEILTDRSNFTSSRAEHYFFMMVGFHLLCDATASAQCLQIGALDLLQQASLTVLNIAERDAAVPVRQKWQRQQLLLEHVKALMTGIRMDGFEERTGQNCQDGRATAMPRVFYGGSMRADAFAVDTPQAVTSVQQVWPMLSTVARKVRVSTEKEKLNLTDTYEDFISFMAGVVNGTPKYRALFSTNPDEEGKFKLEELKEPSGYIRALQIQYWLQVIAVVIGVVKRNALDELQKIVGSDQDTACWNRIEQSVQQDILQRYTHDDANTEKCTEEFKTAVKQYTNIANHAWVVWSQVQKELLTTTTTVINPEKMHLNTVALIKGLHMRLGHSLAALETYFSGEQEYELYWQVFLSEDIEISVRGLEKKGAVQQKPVAVKKEAGGLDNATTGSTQFKVGIGLGLALAIGYLLVGTVIGVAATVGVVLLGIGLTIMGGALLAGCYGLIWQCTQGIPVHNSGVGKVVKYGSLEPKSIGLVGQKNDATRIESGSSNLSIV